MSGYKTLIVRLESLEDPRNEQVVYPLTEVLFIVYASILSGYTTWKGMEDFARFFLNHRYGSGCITGPLI